jgi:hypothetical protein
MLRAWTYGLGVLLVAHGAWFVALQIGEPPSAIIVLLWLSTIVAAFISAYLAPQKKVGLGISMAIPTTILAILLNSLYQLSGKAVDLTGFQGGVILAVVVLVESAILCSLGAFFGSYLSNRKLKKHPTR